MVRETDRDRAHCNHHHQQQEPQPPITKSLRCLQIIHRSESRPGGEEMDFDDNNNSSMWDWQGDEFILQRDAEDDISKYFCDEINQNGDNFLYMMDEQTPIKDCADFGNQVSDSGDWNSDNTNKESEECSQSSQVKRRRMLQFSSDANDIDIGNAQNTSDLMKLKAREDSLMEDDLTENFQWDLQWSSGFPDGRYASGFDGFDQISDGWLANGSNESEMHCSTNEMNEIVPQDDQVDNSGQEFYSIAPAVETNVVQESLPPSRAKIFRGKKSVIKSPKKLSTSVAYPFALIKPCGGQGDVTLKDINQKIHAPPLKSKHVKDDNPCYPTSAFSGKPVVVKTKIHTEGGKGSITIMRTKG